MNKILIASLIVVGLALTACSSNKSSSPKTTTPTQTVSKEPAARLVNYHPKIVPSNFSAKLKNKYFPLKPGMTMTFDGTRDGAPEHVEVTILRKTRSILGVPNIIVSDIVTSNYTLAEKTVDWYTQAANGAVWYFGEDSKEYKNGVVTSTHGSWEAGIDNAQPGVIMQASPRAGGSPYRQEYRPGIAEDMAQVIQVNATLRTPAGTYHGVVQTRDTDPLNPDKVEHKWYAPGVGMIKADRRWTGHHEKITLTKVGKAY